MQQFLQGCATAFLWYAIPTGASPTCGPEGTNGRPAIVPRFKVNVVALTAAWMADMVAHLTGPSLPTCASRALLPAADFDCQDDVFALPPAV